jgi:hypothetical protein
MPYPSRSNGWFLEKILKSLACLNFLFISLWFLSTSSLGQSPNEPKFPEESSIAEMLQGNASFRLVLGRILLDTKRYRVGQFRFKVQEPADIAASQGLRTLTVSLERGQPILVLYRSTPTERWMIEARSNGRCKIDYANSATNYKVTWNQPAHGPIKIELTSENKTQTFSTQSIWHLRFEHPKLCEQHLFPMLLNIEANWNLELIAAETEKRLEEVFQVPPQVTAQQIQALLQEFTSNNASTRDKAHRELRSLGLAILPPLMTLDWEHLEPEQRLRIERLMHTMKPTTDDTPNRLAAWLAGDFAVCERIALNLKGDAKKQGLAYLQALSGSEANRIIR